MKIDLQERFFQNWQAMIFCTKNGEATQPCNMERAVGFAERYFHSELLCECLNIRLAVGF